MINRIYSFKAVELLQHCRKRSAPRGPFLRVMPQIALHPEHRFSALE